MRQDESVKQRLQAVREEAQAEVQKIEDSFRSQVSGQTRLSGILARLSPLTSFNLAAFDLAASGIVQEERWVEGLEAFGDTWQEYSQEKQRAFYEFLESQRSASADGFVMITPADMEAFDNVDLSDAPRFHFVHMGVSDRLTSIYVDLALLALWNVAFFMLAYLSFLRYDIN